MSVSASIGFGLWKEQSFSEIIKLLIANGWEANYHAVLTIVLTTIII